MVHSTVDGGDDLDGLPASRTCSGGVRESTHEHQNAEEDPEGDEVHAVPEVLKEVVNLSQTDVEQDRPVKAPLPVKL